MSYRGRVLQRGPVACYAKPMSYQEQQRKAAELIRLFSIPIYRSYIGPVDEALEQYKRLGLIGTFPYESILPASVSRNVAASKTVWLRIRGNVTFHGSSRIVVPASGEPVYRYIVAVDLSGTSPKVHSTTTLAAIQPSTSQNPRTEDVDESISMVSPTRYVCSSVTGDSSVDNHEIINLPSSNVELYCALACTLDQNAVYLPSYYMTYTTTITADYFFKTQFT